ncbi:MAG: sn-glycerol-3-phosphate ABC transporter ATP-binding protein UgpC [Firmicutes bacterium]|nr:sn-glycerol-3-phosphate ABC transporter ATP-binding protein UgpC [Bacillota bacterium]
MAKISFKNVSKIYNGETEAVSNFSIDIADKEFIVLVGPSGCGKSTVLRMIAGLEEITAGELYIGDRLVNDLPPKERDVAMVFQNYALYPHMTVYKNMAFALENRKVPKAEIDRKVREVAKLLDIEHALKRKPRTMSGGQRQRVALGRAMVRDPAVFLLDEPLSNLDAKLRTSMRSEIIKLHKRSDSTFVYVTHDQTEAMTMGDRIVVMRDGVIQQADTPQNVYRFPCNMFVASFIGMPSMNFLPATLAKDAYGYYLVLQDVGIRLDKAETVLAPYLNRQVIMGIRPDGVRPDPQGVIRAKLEVAEPLGGETHLHLYCCGEKIVAKVNGLAQYDPDQQIPLTFDASHIHLFDAETETVICH